MLHSHVHPVYMCASSLAHIYEIACQCTVHVGMCCGSERQTFASYTVLSFYAETCMCAA